MPFLSAPCELGHERRFARAGLAGYKTGASMSGQCRVEPGVQPFKFEVTVNKEGSGARLHLRPG